MVSHLALQALYIGLETVIDVLIVWKEALSLFKPKGTSDASALELYKIARPFSSD